MLVFSLLRRSSYIISSTIWILLVYIQIDFSWATFSIFLLVRNEEKKLEMLAWIDYTKRAEYWLKTNGLIVGKRHDESHSAFDIFYNWIQFRDIFFFAFFCVVFGWICCSKADDKYRAYCVCISLTLSNSLPTMTIITIEHHLFTSRTESFFVVCYCQWWMKEWIC